MPDPGHASGNQTARSWVLRIPAPAGWLNANKRADRRAASGTVRTWREAALIHARHAKLPKLARAHILAELRFCDRIRRDAHNYYPTLKAIVDGLVDYGLLVDDSTDFLDGPDIRLGKPIPKPAYGPGGEVVLTIREVS